MVSSRFEMRKILLFCIAIKLYSVVPATVVNCVLHLSFN